MTALRDPGLFDRQDLLRLRRLERGLAPDAPPLASARRLLLLGGSVGLALLVAVLFSWSLAALRSRMISAEISRMAGVPGMLQTLESQLRAEKSKLDQRTKSNQALAGGLVSVSSSSALLTQLAELTPQGIQITEALVSGQGLTLRGRAEEPEAFSRINAFSLLLAYAPLFKPDVRVIKISREAAGTDPKAALQAAPVGWEMGVNLASLKPTPQLSLMRKLGADGMARRLQDLARTGVLP